MDKKANFEQRLWFVYYWADYVKTHTNKDWSRQQKKFIDSVISGSNNDIALYMRVKGEKCTRN